MYLEVSVFCFLVYGKSLLFGASKVFANHYLLIDKSFSVKKIVFIINTKSFEIFLYQILLGTLGTISTSRYTCFLYLEVLRVLSVPRGTESARNISK